MKKDDRKKSEKLYARVENFRKDNLVEFPELAEDPDSFEENIKSLLSN